ncbi:MAG: imidazole glycerol phosphate synthase subunit HisF [Firmicutes bacterium]|nr:imidazole glycerol phosphate synthase subunit HisF [Bacillota bacterium]
MTDYKRIIPCLDIKDGRIVKGTNFVGLRDVGDPVELAAVYNQSGADEIVFLDITASTEDRSILFDVLERTAAKLTIPLIVGGGIRSTEDIRKILAAGASKVSISSAAVTNPNLIQQAAEEFGRQRIVIAIDVKWSSENNYWEVVTQGGRNFTGLNALEWAREVEELGAGEILLTSMDADGTKNGYDTQLTAAVADEVSIPIIASGGAGKLEDFRDILTIGKADAALAASLFHFQELSVQQVKDYLASCNIPVKISKA